ncbi:hypothetical protein A9Q76_01355 [Arcobacter sp. 31_11_sub10_T18]|nr:hypothetical protein A9Q76_01355 [Arcobacter sp. 31_11_sub10_T18]
MLLRNYVKNLLTNQNEIFQFWIENKEVEDIFKTYVLNRDDFVSSHASSLLEFYIQTINDESKVKKYKLINTLFEYFKKNKIKEFELYTIIKSFKNAILNYFEVNELNTYELQKEINEIFEVEFASLLKLYSQNEDKLENQLKHFYNLVNQYIIMSSTDLIGNITQVTDAFCEASGYSREELIGQPHSIVRHPDMKDTLFQELWSKIQTGESWQGEIKNLKKDGSSYWVDAKILPTFNEDNVVVGYDAVRQDITAQKVLEEQQQMLTQQSKSAAMGEMISMIAHQWRQPLQTISILVQKLPLTRMLGDDISDELLEQVLDDVNIQIDYMTNTIEDFRDFFKPNKEKNEIDINELVLKAVDFLSYMLNLDSIHVNIQKTKDRKIAVHVNEIIQVLINIIKNARDVMIDNELGNREINIITYVTDEYAVIEIEDNAGGIPPEIIGKVFDPYFSTKLNKNGTGLGLYMSKTIIEQHSLGKLTVSNSTLGAVFKIELPL